MTVVTTMDEDKGPGRAYRPGWVWRAVLALCITFGVIIRFVHLDRQVVWHDEAYILMQVAGFSKAEMVTYLYDHDLRPADLLRLQRVQPDRWLRHALNVLAVEDPQLTPLFHVLTYYWMRLFGDDVAHIRLLPALAGVLALAALFGLGLELFHAVWSAALAAALVAVSPFHVIYAREIREYSLWTLMIALSSYLLLRAMRQPTRRGWAAYALSASVGLYSHLFFSLVMLAHGLYVLAHTSQGWRWPLVGQRQVRLFVLASAGAGLAFMAWGWRLLVEMVSGRWSSRLEGPPVSALEATGWWLDGLFHLFVDPGVWREGLAWRALEIPVLVILLAALVTTWRRLATPTRRFLLSLTLAPLAALVLLDAVSSSPLAVVSRYFIPTYLGLHLILVYMLARLMSQGGRRWLGQGLAVALVLIGAWSSLTVTADDVVRSKGVGVHMPNIARIINQADHPLLIGPRDTGLYHAAVLSRLVRPDAVFRLVLDVKTLPPLPQDRDVFVLFPRPEEVQSMAASGRQVDDVYLGVLYHLR